MYEVIKPKSNKQTKVVEALDIDVQKSFTEYLNKISIEDEPYKNIFLIQMYMGLRIGEVLALSKESIDLENKVLYVKRTLTNDKEFAIILGNKTKTYSGNRILPIPEFLVPIFEEQLKYTNENLHNLIFTNNAIELSLAESSNKQEFIKSMNKLGYQVNWTDTRKYITYTTPEGYKCRDNKLYEEKYTKGVMENEFRRIKEEQSNSTRQSSNSIMSVVVSTSF